MKCLMKCLKDILLRVPTCVELPRTEGGGDVGAEPLPVVPGIRHQLPARVTDDQTAGIPLVLLMDVVTAEKALAAVLVDEELLVAGADAQGVGGLVTHVVVGLAATGNNKTCGE